MNEVWIGRTRRTPGSIVAAVDDRIFPSGDIMTLMNDSDGTSFWNGTSALRVLSVLLLVFLPLSGALAQPTVTGTSGEWEHGRSVTIVGGGFGIKNPAAPLWWDNGEGQVLNNHSVVRSRYNDAWPRSVTQDGGASNIQYRATGHRGVSTPHKFSDTFISGCHDDQGECLGGEVGQNVGLTVSDGNRHEKWYVSYYLRLDPAWPIGGGNYKYFNWETSSPYLMYSNPFCYDNVNGCTSGYLNGRRAPDCKESWWGSPQLVQVLDMNTCGDWLWDHDPSLYGGPVVTGDRGVANPAHGWIKEEHILSTANSPYLFYQTLVNNVAMLDTTRDEEGDCRHSDRGTNPFGGVTMGGFWKGGMCGNNQDDLDDNACRFFDDVYVDSTLSRVILCDAPNYNSCRTLEPQPPTSWDGNSIVIKVNQGALGQTAYLYVFDANNNHNAAGYPIEFGQSGGQLVFPPNNLKIGR